MRSPRTVQVLAAIAAECFVSAAVAYIAAGQESWWRPALLVVSAVLTGVIALRGWRRLRQTA